MKIRLLLAACALVLGACAADSSFPVPLSTDNPPPPGAVADQHCMEDCLSDNTDAAICHDRCAK